MLLFKWLSVLTIMGWLFSSPVAAQSTNSQGATSTQLNASQEPAPKKDQVRPSIPVTIVESPAQAADSAAREKRADEHDASDLDAQVSSAVAANRQVLIGVGSALLSLVGTLLLFMNLKEARRATRAAQDAANSARETLNGERAWLLFDGSPIIPRDNLTYKGVDYAIGIDVGVSFKNFGRSPSTKTGVAMQAGFLVEPIENRDYGLPDLQAVNSEGVAVVPPGGPFAGSRMAIVGDDYIKLMSRTGKFCIACVVVYRDIYQPSEQRRTTVIVEIVHNGINVDEEGKRFPNFETSMSRMENTAT
jgi:hypothetical protein